MISTTTYTVLRYGTQSCHIESSMNTAMYSNESMTLNTERDNEMTQGEITIDSGGRIHNLIHGANDFCEEIEKKMYINHILSFLHFQMIHFDGTGYD